MKIIDRHILMRLTTSFVALTAVLVIFFVLLHYVEYVDDFVDSGASMRDVFLVYYPSYIPEIVRLTCPASVFLAVIFLTGRLAQQQQIMALYASGVSLYRLVYPYFLFGLAATVTVFFFNGWMVPQANKVRIEFENEYLRERSDAGESGLIHRQIGPETVLTVGYFDRTLNLAHRVSLQQFDGPALAERLDAQQMQWIDSLQTWRFTTVYHRTFSDLEEQREVVASIDSSFSLHPRELAQTESDMDLLTLPQAKRYIESLRRVRVANIGVPEVKYLGKFTFPLANLIVIFLGLAIASQKRKGGQGRQMAIGLLVAFSYLSTILIFEPFGYSGTLSPAWAATLPHIMFLVIGLLLLVSVRK